MALDFSAQGVRGCKPRLRYRDRDARDTPLPLILICGFTRIYADVYRHFGAFWQILADLGDRFFSWTGGCPVEIQSARLQTAHTGKKEIRAFAAMVMEVRAYRYSDYQNVCPLSRGRIYYVQFRAFFDFS